MIIMIIKYLLTVATLHLLLTGCSSNKDVLNDNFPPEIHVSEQKKISNHQYNNAIKKLKALDNRARFGPYSQQVKLDLIYWHYKSRNFRLAKASIDRFFRLNPTHPNVDYVLYMRGLTNMSLDENDIQSVFGVDRLDRNPEHARVAFCDFSQLIQEYPNSQYAMDAYRRLMFLKNRLARYELSVVEYYSKRSAYVAVANRVEQMLRNFSDTQSTRQALPYMEKAYRELQLIGQAEKVAKIISENDKYRMH